MNFLSFFFKRESYLIFIFLSFLFLFHISCVENQGQDSYAKEENSSTSDNQFTVNGLGDTVLTGVPIQAKVISGDLGSVSQPKVVPQKRQPVSKIIRNNIQPAGKPVVVPIPENLTTIIPGKKGIPQPRAISVQSNIMPFLQPKQNQALSPRMKEEASYDLQNLDLDQGMMSSYLRFLLEDSKGNLWIGTSHGVSSYNGRSFRHYTTRQGLLGNSIWSMLEDSRGDLWFGTDNGISRFDGHQFFHYQVNLGVDLYEVKAIIEDKQGNLWFGTSSGVLFYKVSENDLDHYGRFIHFTTREGLVDNGVLSIMEDSWGELWFGTAGGVCRYSTDKGFIHYTTDEGLTNNLVSSIEEDVEGRVWFGTDKGLTYYTPSGGDNSPQGSFSQFAPENDLIKNQIFHILRDRQDNLWFAYSGGVGRFNGADFIHYKIEGNVIRYILEDSQERLWLATGGKGLFRLDPNSFSHFDAEKNLSGNDFTSITEDKQGNIWFGTYGSAIKYNLQESNQEKIPGVFSYYTTREGLINDEILSVLVDSKGDIWFGTSGGVSRYNGADFVHFTTEDGLVYNEVKLLLEDSKGNIWFITTNGVSRFDGTSFTQFTTAEGLISNKVRSVIEDSRGRIWFAGSGGVSRFDPAGEDRTGRSGYFTHYTTSEGLSGNEVRSLLEDREGNIWLGTYGNGLDRYDPAQDQFSHYTIEDGLSNNVIWSLLEDAQGNIWISTEQGITLMKKKSIDSEERQFFTFKKEEGLKRLDFQSNSAWLDHQNQMWWGTVSGLAMLDLDRFQVSMNPPKSVQLTYVEINQQFIDYRQMDSKAYRDQFSFGEDLFQAFDSVVAFSNYPTTMTLPNYLNHLTFHFSAIDWGGAHKIQYQYLMEGDAEWSPAGEEPKAEYRNLARGTYTFRVRACGEAGVWSEPFEYTFIILSPWWLTWWAYILYVLLLAGVIYIVFSIFKRRWLLQNTLVREREEAARLQELNSLKTRFFANVSHELRTPLTLLTSPVNFLLKEKKLTVRQTKLLQMASESGKQLELLINEILDLNKLEMGKVKLDEKPTELASFFSLYFMQFESLATSKKMNYSYEIEIDDGVVADIDREKCRQILYNLLSNAFKYVPAGERIEAKVSMNESVLQLSVADSGPGIHSDDLPHLFERYFQTNQPDKSAEGGTGIGLALCHEYTRLFGGKIEVESDQGKGTIFNVTFPVSIKDDLTAQVNLAESPIGQEVLTESDQLHTQNDGNQSSPSKDQIKETLLPANQAKPAILVVEDNPNLQHYIRVILEEKYEIITAGNGREALEYLVVDKQRDRGKSFEPALILSDLMMPIMDGYQLLEKLKSDDGTRHIPVVMLTARTDIRDKLKALRIGVDDYLVKPFDQEELLVRIENLLKNQAGRRSGIPAESSQEEEESSILTSDQEWLETFELFVRKHLSNDILSVPSLAAEFAMSESTLYRHLKRLTGLSTVKYLQEVRLNEAKRLLENRTYNSVSQVASEVGYGNARSFTRNFKNRFGKLPSAFFED